MVEKKTLVVVGVLVIVVLLVLGAMRRQQVQEPMPEPSTDSVLGPGDYEFSLVHDALTRTYEVHVPSSYDKNVDSPLVINLHGGTGNAGAAQRQSNMNEKSDDEGFIVVYPEGTGPQIGDKTLGLWNAGRCCGPVAEHRDNIDDVGFIGKMLDKLEVDFSIDTDRIYTTGLSNGALISYRLACEMSDRIAAIAPIGAHDSFDECHPTRPVSIIHFHGTADPCAYYDGGDPCGGGCAAELMGKDPGSGWACSSVPGYIDEWKTINGCSDDGSVSYQNGNATCVTYSDCDNGTEVVLCSIEGGGHTWPGGERASEACVTAPNGPRCKKSKETLGPISYDISANDEMWKFFKKHPMS